MITGADRAELQALRPIALRALRAPSVHNTQPWTFVLQPGRFSIRAERGRQLHVLDPSGRQLVISCGCALFNVRVAAAAEGFRATVARQPAADDPDLLAVVTLDRDGHDEQGIATLSPAIAARRTNRRRFRPEPVPAEVLTALSAAAEAEGAHLIEVLSDTDRSLVAQLSQLADEAQYRNPSYRAELRAWTTDDPDRLDGVPAIAVPHVDGPSGDDIPIRDFDTRGTGYLPSETRSTRDQCLVLLGTDADVESSWLHAGEALERVLLEVAVRGYAVSPLTQVIEVPSARAELRTGLGLAMYPHVLLRIGKAEPTAGTPRRHLADVLVELGRDGER